MSDGTHERALLAAFEADGYAGLRAPASGSATARDLPDLLVGTRYSGPPGGLILFRVAECYAIEIKTTSATTAYVDGAEVAALERFATAFGARPLLAAKFKQSGRRQRFYLVPPADARGPTEGGRYGLPVADIEERAALVASPPTDAKPGRIERPND